MQPVRAGYAFLIDALKLTALPPRRVAVVRPVTRLAPSAAELSVPARTAPHDDHPLSHVLFALRHEGTELSVLAQALPRIEAADLMRELRRTPNGAFIRKACALWERFTGRHLQDLPPRANRRVPLFDPLRYVTCDGPTDPRWQIHCNGLGDFDYCATVERTDAIQNGIDSGLLEQAERLMQSLGAAMVDRVLAWAYLHETQDSFAIEREAPSQDRTRRYVELLKHASLAETLTEQRLVELQNATVSSPYVMAASFRHRQNWLQGPGRGAASISYVPPPPDILPSLMDSWMALSNRLPRQVHPLVAASVLSFGFVFLHPFEDGNGRLSRFLFHKALCDSGHLRHGLLLPVSVALKRNESGYLAALQRYSRPVRERWNVTWLDAGQFDFHFRSDPSIYRYWNATDVVEFGMRMAREALETDLHNEVTFLQRYDGVYRTVNDAFDVRGSDLSQLIVMALDNGGTVSRRRRDQFGGRVPVALFDAIEAAIAAGSSHSPSTGE